MKDYFTIGSSPAAETCVQVGTEDYKRKSFIECNHFITALKKKFGEPPANTSLEIKGFPHDFGTYHEVVCYFETTDIESGEYACRCESGTPMTWAEIGMEKPEF